jgi:hypothetical protein
LTKHRDLTVRSMASEHWPPSCSPPRSARRVPPSRSGVRSKTHPRSVPLSTDVVDAFERWRELRDEITELAHNPFVREACRAPARRPHSQTRTDSCRLPR